MNTFINLSAIQSKGFDEAIFKNAKQLKKDALLIAANNKSYSSATSLLVLSSEEVIKAILVLLHSQEYKVYQIKDAKKFFIDHKVRHEIATILEFLNGIAAGLMTIDQKKEVLEVASSNNDSFLTKLKNGLNSVKDFLEPISNSLERIKAVQEFDALKNKGLYVDYKDQLIIPQTAIKQYTFRKTKDSVDQIFKHYKIIKLLFHPKLKNHLSQEEINKTKLGLKVVIDGLLGG
jgi:AbiV family abortive infection protein